MVVGVARGRRVGDERRAGGRGRSSPLRARAEVGDVEGAASRYRTHLCRQQQSSARGYDNGYWEARINVTCTCPSNFHVRISSKGQLIFSADPIPLHFLLQ
jgi:hypothetical protein